MAGRQQPSVKLSRRANNYFGITAHASHAWFACALARHWATDPHYANTLLKVHRDNGLAQATKIHPKTSRHRGSLFRTAGCLGVW